MRLLAHPFRLSPAGAAVTVEDGSDESDAQAIAVLVSTRLGERGLAPDYGVDDPVFGDLEPADIAAGLAEFGPPLTITDVDITVVDDTHEDVVIYYTDADTELDDADDADDFTEEAPDAVA